eukprot:850066-Prorocentrum_minimum.AAC.5
MNPSPSMTLRQERLADAVVTCFFIDCFENIVACLERVHRMLRPGGRRRVQSQGTPPLSQGTPALSQGTPSSSQGTPSTNPRPTAPSSTSSPPSERFRRCETDLAGAVGRGRSP